MFEIFPFSSKKTFPHGVHPPEAKEATRNKPIRRLPFAPFLILHLAQHAGKPAISLVREGQEVLRGQKLAEADGFVSAPIHAPATGVVRRVGMAMDVNGKMEPAIVLEPYRGSEQLDQSAQTISPEEMENLSPQAIIQGIAEMGMVGLGGAAFPTHVKLTPPKDKPIHTLIVNGCECEPYLTADHRVMLEYPDELLLGTWLVKKALGAGEAIIALESNKKDAALKLMERLAAQPESKKANIRVEVLPTKYPQGAEKMLASALLSREVPSGGLPSDIGLMVSNATTLAEIGTLLPQGGGLIERVLTVTGGGVERPGNYMVPVGTPLSFLLAHVGLKEEASEVLFGGPMMGKGVAFMETPITKGVSGILVLTGGEGAPVRKTYPCIKCGACLDACPMRLNPSALGVLSRQNRFQEMADGFHLFDCFECGSCSFVCPSQIPLVQLFRVAKQVLRERV